jgi:hypothetical protein
MTVVVYVCLNVGSKLNLNELVRHSCSNPQKCSVCVYTFATFKETLLPLYKLSVLPFEIDDVRHNIILARDSHLFIDLCAVNTVRAHAHAHTHRHRHKRKHRRRHNTHIKTDTYTNIHTHTYAHIRVVLL